jgi:signal transduction histidine kinase
MHGAEATFRGEYAAALADFLNVKSESALFQAAAVGRKALADGLGVLDMVEIHHAGLTELLRTHPEGTSLEAVVDASNTFFCEALSPFEMAHRGFREISGYVTRVLQFAAVVSHELRTPLTSLMSSVGMLSEIRDPSPRTDEGRLLANITASVMILKSRTDDLMDLVGFQSGTLSIKPVEVDLPALLRGVVDRMADKKTGVEVCLTVTGEIPVVTADHGRLEQVVSNLVQNAFKYGADGRRIDVRASARTDAVCIEVQDYGAGVSLWDRMKIWQLNYRGTGRALEIPGLGIGLALCKELVEQHRGSITLESEEGKGSLFRVELPLHGPKGEGGDRRESPDH